MGLTMAVAENNEQESDFRMTLKNGVGKCSLFVLSATDAGMKISKHGLFVFPPKKT